MIANNYIIAHEIIHLRKSKKKCKTMGLKLDMTKAYDQMEWNFLLMTLNAIGFNNKLIQLIHEYISSVSYSIFWNGSSIGNFHTSGGLRQGDSLAPYCSFWGWKSYPTCSLMLKI